MTERNLPAVQTEDAPATPALRVAPAATAARARSFFPEPTTPEEAMQFARLIADSDLAPKDYRGKPGNVVIAIEMGREVGLAPMQALAGIAVINGRASIWGDALIGLVRGNAVCEFVSEEESGEGDAFGWTCTAKRRGDPNLVVNRFTVADAKRAGLFSKDGPWKNYPSRMLKLRARGFTLRDAFADVLKGLAMREEVEDYDESMSVADALAAPTRTEAVKRILSAKTPRGSADVPATTVTAPSEHELAIRGKSLTEIGEIIRAKAASVGVDDDELRKLVATVPGGKLQRSTAALVLEMLADRERETIEMAPAATAAETPPAEEDAPPSIDLATMTREQLIDHVRNRAVARGISDAALNIVIRAHAEHGLTVDNVGAVLAEIDKRGAR